MPIRHQIQPMNKILQFFDVDIPKNLYLAQTGRVFFKIPDPGARSTKRIILTVYDRDNQNYIHTMSLIYEYQGRTDVIRYSYDPIYGPLHIKCSTQQSGIVKEDTYPIIQTEEEFFQASTITDLSDCTVQDFIKIQKLFEHYYPRALEIRNGKD